MKLVLLLAWFQEDALPPRQRLVAILLAAAMLLAVLELVRRRRLREEYSVLWVVTAIALFILALEYRILIWLTSLIGAAVPNSTLFFGGILFVMLLSLQFSVRLSRLTYRMRKLTRQVALLQEELRELRVVGRDAVPGVQEPAAERDSQVEQESDGEHGNASQTKQA